MIKINWNDPRVKRNTLLGLAGIALFGLLATFISGVPLSTNPVFCGKMCHATSPEYESWSRSSHAEVACHFCHMDRSYIGLYKEKIIDPINRFMLVKNDSFDKPINEDSFYSQRAFSSARCLRCHSPERRNFTGQRGLNVTSAMHLKHLDSGLTCTTCHNRIAHLGAEKYPPLKQWKPGFKYKNFMSMREGCWRCHSDDPKYRDPQALAIIGDKVPPTSCAACHNSKWTLKPTSGDFDHEDKNGTPWRDGKRRHGKIAKRDFGACFACHAREPDGNAAGPLPNCSTSCHKGVTMPHNVPKWAKYFRDPSNTPQWLRVHADEADKLGVSAANWRVTDNQNTCSMCHNKDKKDANFCQTCHHLEFESLKQNASGIWKNEHPEVVKEIGSPSCQKCHLLEFCAYCHTNGEKPARGQFFNRSRSAAPITLDELEELAR